MNQGNLITLLERNSDVLCIESEAPCLQYFAHPNDKNRIAIAGKKGVTIVTIEQAHAIAKEIEYIADTYAGKEKIIYGDELERHNRPFCT